MRRQHPHRKPLSLALLPSGLCALMLLLTMHSLPANAQTQWKWRDASGKVLYSDLPPPAGIPDKDILQRPPGQRVPVVVRPITPAAATPAAAPASVAPKASAAPSRAEQERQNRARQEQEQQARKQKEEERRLAEQRAENCKRATSHLRMIEDGMRISRRNEAGETEFLDERQRAEEAQRTRAIISSDCR
ncbi:DUF4124 domain-containing protein [Roseateles sp.]|jgi:hypothetical protein|uniref:DUF4124 domain-containing protein n=1 Tax=Roseateles sp. TaxID=1971397 RepID=UPI00391AA6B6